MSDVRAPCPITHEGQSTIFLYLNELLKTTLPHDKKGEHSVDLRDSHIAEEFADSERIRQLIVGLSHQITGSQLSEALGWNFVKDSTPFSKYDHIQSDDFTNFSSRLHGILSIPDRCIEVVKPSDLPDILQHENFFNVCACLLWNTYASAQSHQLNTQALIFCAVYVQRGLAGYLAQGLIQNLHDNKNTFREHFIDSLVILYEEHSIRHRSSRDMYRLAVEILIKVTCSIGDRVNANNDVAIRTMISQFLCRILTKIESAGNIIVRILLDRALCAPEILGFLFYHVAMKDLNVLRRLFSVVVEIWADEPSTKQFSVSSQKIIGISMLYLLRSALAYAQKRSGLEEDLESRTRAITDTDDPTLMEPLQIVLSNVTVGGFLSGVHHRLISPDQSVREWGGLVAMRWSELAHKRSLMESKITETDGTNVVQSLILEEYYELYKTRESDETNEIALFQGLSIPVTGKNQKMTEMCDPTCASQPIRMKDTYNANGEGIEELKTFSSEHIFGTGLKKSESLSTEAHNASFRNTLCLTDFKSTPGLSSYCTPISFEPGTSFKKKSLRQILLLMQNFETDAKQKRCSNTLAEEDEITIEDYEFFLQHLIPEKLLASPNRKFGENTMNNEFDGINIRMTCKDSSQDMSSSLAMEVVEIVKHFLLPRNDYGLSSYDSSRKRILLLATSRLPEYVVPYLTHQYFSGNLDLSTRFDILTTLQETGSQLANHSVDVPAGKPQSPLCDDKQSKTLLKRYPPLSKFSFRQSLKDRTTSGNKHKPIIVRNVYDSVAHIFIQQLLLGFQSSGTRFAAEDTSLSSKFVSTLNILLLLLSTSSHRFLSAWYSVCDFIHAILEEDLHPFLRTHVLRASCLNWERIESVSLNAAIENRRQRLLRITEDMLYRSVQTENVRKAAKDLQKRLQNFSFAKAITTPLITEV